LAALGAVIRSGPESVPACLLSPKRKLDAAEDRHPVGGLDLQPDDGLRRLRAVEPEAEIVLRWRPAPPARRQEPRLRAELRAGDAFSGRRVEEACRWPDLRGLRRWDKPWLDGLPRLVFLSDMSDALCEDVPFAFLETEIIDNVTALLGIRHQWLWLTKRPDRMAEFSGWLSQRGVAWPENLWAGTSITSPRWTRRIDRLLEVGTERTIRFVSVEPQWEPVDLGRWLPRVDWVIQGGQSGHDAMPFQLTWAKDLKEQCREAGVPYFLKQLGANVMDGRKRLNFEDSHGGDWSEWPKDVRVRQVPASPKALVRTPRMRHRHRTCCEVDQAARGHLNFVGFRAIM